MTAMQMKPGNYEVYRLLNNDLGEEVTAYFTPRTSWSDRFQRDNTIKDYKSRGYVVTAAVFVDHETYLNIRLNDVVQDYCAQDRDEQVLRARFRAGEINKHVYVDTMKLIADNRWRFLKQLDSLMRRIQSEDYDCFNEVAIQLYDRFIYGLMT